MSNDIANILNDLIKTSKDGEEGFILAAQHLLIEQDLKSIILDRTEGCKKAVEVLQKLVVQFAVKPEESGSVLGAVHRGWLNIKSMLTDDDAYAILAECERGEDIAKSNYSKALSHDLPDDIRIVVQHQYEGVLKNHDLIKRLRDKHATKK